MIQIFIDLPAILPCSDYFQRQILYHGTYLENKILRVIDRLYPQPIDHGIDVWSILCTTSIYSSKSCQIILRFNYLGNPLLNISMLLLINY